MAHLPLILSPAGGKLSKRSADRLGIPVSVRDYIKDGYLPEALINFLALLGWNPGTEQEIFAIDDLVESFDLTRVGASGVQFNIEKLNWFNQQHLRRKSAKDIVDAAGSALSDLRESVGQEYLERVVEIVRDRLTFANEIGDYSEFFRDPVAYDSVAVAKKWIPGTGKLLVELAGRLEDVTDFEAETVESAVNKFVDDTGTGKSKLMPAIRIAISGRAAGPPLFESLELIGREAVVRRLRRGVESLG
jgi:glutamyl-tRNA synthetase